ncbi:MAG: electron transfer flavoprotein subunit alpha/FixB family protein [Spirochaetia bacterium]|nr:electron transfer flavoprotein subunit alpha/FixB family protein [Spirochaetia bacterium]
MSKALVVGEIKNEQISKVTLEMASRAKELKMDVSVIFFGAGAENAAKSNLSGVARSLFHESSDYNGEVIAEAVSKVVKSGNYEIILIPHTWMGRDISGRIGALLDSSVISDIVDLQNEGGKLIARKPVYAGKAYVKLAHKSGVKIFSVRPNVFAVTQNKTEPSSETPEKIEADYSKAKAKRVEFKSSQGAKIGLTEASIIISGGRGVKGPEYFPVLQELADMLGAALGASRATVDAGWIDHSHQVGQTGKTVSPILYIAVGISGAIQHLAGMGSSKYIVAINKDPEAPIFKVSTYGIVDDLFNIVPPLKNEIKALKG